RAVVRRVEVRDVLRRVHDDGSRDGAVRVAALHVELRLVRVGVVHPVEPSSHLTSSLSGARPAADSRQTVALGAPRPMSRGAYPRPSRPHESAAGQTVSRRCLCECPRAPSLCAPRPPGPSRLRAPRVRLHPPPSLPPLLPSPPPSWS